MPPFHTSHTSPSFSRIMHTTHLQLAQFYQITQVCITVLRDRNQMPVFVLNAQSLGSTLVDGASPVPAPNGRQGQTLLQLCPPTKSVSGRKMSHRAASARRASGGACFEPKSGKRTGLPRYGHATVGSRKSRCRLLRHRSAILRFRTRRKSACIGTEVIHHSSQPSHQRADLNQGSSNRHRAGRKGVTKAAGASRIGWRVSLLSCSRSGHSTRRPGLAG